jgi:hypothetical protein
VTSKKLLKEGADPNAACEGGITPVMVMCLMQCCLYGAYILDHDDMPDSIRRQLHDFKDNADVEDAKDRALLKVLLSHGARIDLVYPGDFDVLEAAAIAGPSDLIPVLLAQQPYASMAAGTWSSSSSSSQECGAGAAAATAAGAEHSSSSSSVGGRPAATFAVKVLDRHSRPLSWAAEWCSEFSELGILAAGWDPMKHPDDAGEALLTVCGKVSRSVYIRASSPPTDAHTHGGRLVGWQPWAMAAGHASAIPSCRQWLEPLVFNVLPTQAVQAAGIRCLAFIRQNQVQLAATLCIVIETPRPSYG